MGNLTMGGPEMVAMGHFGSKNSLDFIKSFALGAFGVWQGLSELHFGPGLASRSPFWSELDRHM